MNCDLHTHSLYSDGSFTPAEIISEAKRLGIAVALTDHNTVSGLREFEEEAKKQGVKAVTGVEFTTEYNKREFHMLGLFIKPEYYGLIEKTAKVFAELKEKNNLEMARRLNSAGYHINYSDVKKRSANGNVNRVQFAEELVDKGYISSIDEGFETILNEDNVFYVPTERLDTVEAIRLLREIDAVPVLAHPLDSTDEQFLREMLPALIDAGLVGMEVQHSSYDSQKIADATRIAAEFGLLPSGGSDFHGTRKKGIYLEKGKGNLAVPIEWLYNLEKSLDK